MSKGKAIIFRGYMAIGDALYTSALPRLMKEDGYEQVDVAVWQSNQHVFWNNPYVDNIRVFPNDLTETEFEYYYNKWNEEYDVIVDLRWTIESKYLFRTDAPLPPIEERKKKNKGKNYYRVTMEVAGYKVDKGKPELYLSDEEEKLLNEFKKENPKFVIWQLYGSSNAKQLVRAPIWITEIMKQVPDCKHYLVGNAHFSTKRLFGSDNVKCVAGIWGLRTSMLMCKYANLVVGPESAITNASGAFDTPKFIMYSGVLPENLGGDFENHYGFCPKCECYPCYKISISPKEVWNLKKRKLAYANMEECRVKDPFDCYRYLGFKCTLSLPEQEIIEKAVDILKHS